MKLPLKNKLAFNFAIQIIAAVAVISSGFYFFANIQTTSLKQRIVDKAELFSLILGTNLDKIIGDNLKSIRELQEATELVAKTSSSIEELTVIAPNSVILSSTVKSKIWRGVSDNYRRLVEEVIADGKSMSITKTAIGKEIVVHFLPLFREDPGSRRLMGILQVMARFPSQQGQGSRALRASNRGFFKAEASSIAQKLARDLEYFLKETQRNLGYLNGTIEKMKMDVDIDDIKIFLNELGVLLGGSQKANLQFIENSISPLHDQVMRRKSTLMGSPQGNRNLVEIASPLYLTSGQGEKIAGAVSILFSLDRTYATIVHVRNNILIMSVAIIGTFCLLIILFFHRKIFAPVNEMITITESIKKGDFTRQCHVYANDELGKLANALNNMMGELERTKSEIEEFNVRLQEKVTEVSEDLKEKQDQLFESEKLASLGALSSGIAHEINNPLGVILGHTQLLLKEFKEKGKIKDPKLAEELLESIELYTKRCSHIVKSLLQFTRKRELQFEETDIHAALENALLFTSGRMARKEISIEKSFAEALPSVLADSIQLEQVFINILFNAEQAIEKNGKIRITTQSHNDIIKIKFEDNGGGIEDELLEKIFDPFFSTKEPGEGVGLGLSVSYGIIKAHGGSVTVDSKKGSSTKVTIQLPAKK